MLRGTHKSSSAYAVFEIDMKFDVRRRGCDTADRIVVPYPFQHVSTVFRSTQEDEVTGVHDVVLQLLRHAHTPSGLRNPT